MAADDLVQVSPSSATAQRQGRAMFASLPPPFLLLLSIMSVQLGAAFAKQLFALTGPGGAVFLRAGFGSLILMVLWRPRLTAFSRRQWLSALLFGLTLAAMNFSFYNAIARLPLGVAVTIEFVGPLTVAIAGSRHRLDLAWALMAALGVMLFAPWTGAQLDLIGIGCALLAAIFWATYIFLSARVGRQFSGGDGLALAMVVAALALTPVGIWSLGSNLGSIPILGIGVLVGLLSTVIPYSLELEALRRIPASVFGIFMSLEPAIAALVGLVVLREVIGPRELAAILLVTAASIGAVRTGTRKR